MSKFVQAILSGIFFTFILDFFLFLGIKLNYIDFYNIDLYYNILFADNQNIYIFAVSSVVLGLLVMYAKNKISIAIISLLFILVLSTLIPSIGHKTGEILLMKKNTVYKNAKYTFTGDAYYIGRKQITFYDYELKKIILLDKDELLIRR